MIGNVIQNRLLVAERLSGRLRAVVHPDGRDPRRGRRLRQAPRHRTADRLMATTTTAATPVAIARPAPRARVRARSPARCCRVHGPRDHLPAGPDRGDDHLLVQRARRQVQLRMARVLAQRLAPPIRLAGAPDSVRDEPRGRGPLDHLRHDHGDDDRARLDPILVPRAGRPQRHHLPADGDARDRARGQHADPVRRDGAAASGRHRARPLYPLASRRSSSPTSCSTSASSW